MPADEHVRRSFDTLAARLREDISRQLDALGHELASAIHDEHSREVSAVIEEQARERSRTAQAHESALELARRDAHEESTRQWELARAEALELARAEREAADLGASTRLVEAIRALDRAKTLSEILDTLASAAGREAARAALLLVRGSTLRGWRFIGFGAPLDDAVDYEMAADDAGIIADVVRTGAPMSGDSAASGSAPAFASLPPGRETLALPITMSGHIVAVLYADQGDGEANTRMAWPASLEVITRHAARSLEAVTALRAAQLLTERPDVAGPPSQPRTAAPSHEDEEGARRYARLLISEIKLYHEPEVIAGKRERDLAQRLAGEIARARALYEQRVPAPVRGRADYFGDELVRTLADGDADLVVAR